MWRRVGLYGWTKEKHEGKHVNLFSGGSVISKSGKDMKLSESSNIFDRESAGRSGGGGGGGGSGGRLEAFNFQYFLVAGIAMVVLTLGRNHFATYGKALSKQVTTKTTRHFCLCSSSQLCFRETALMITCRKTVI